MEYTIKEGNYKNFGACKEGSGITFTFAGEKEDDCRLIFYDDKNNVIRRIEIPADYCMGSVRSVHISGITEKYVRYNYEINGEIRQDAYAEKIIGREKWNDEGRGKYEFQICCGIEDSGKGVTFDWEEDRFPEIRKSEMVMYKLHVRGFSMDAGIRGKSRGTFGAVKDKIPYLKELGITTVEFMPLYEFEEIIFKEAQKLPEYLIWESEEEDLIKPETGKKAAGLNYWGYTEGNYFAVKASYAGVPDAAQELKELIKELHKNRMECVMEIYFGKEQNCNILLDALRFWVREFHVDGFHLTGEGIPTAEICQDMFLSRTKIFCERFYQENLENRKNYPNLYVYNEEYLYTARRMLNHINGSFYDFVNQQKKQNESHGFVNFIANVNGFTLMDVFSYEEKHNEENGESNEDGNNWNFSSNCGAEGRTGKKSVNELRKKQVCNAFAMLFLGQGVPLILSGDEMGNSQGGNNNAYCQDNKVGWINWKKNEKNRWLTEFVAKLIAFRRAHPIVSLEKPMQMSDYLHKGFPDLSYHGENAWITGYPHDNAAFGMMFCGNYAKREDNTTDDYIYIGYNFQNGISRLALPKLPEKKKWYLVMNTERPEEAFLPKEQALSNQQQLIIKAQSTVLLIGK